MARSWRILRIRWFFQGVRFTLEWVFRGLRLVIFSYLMTIASLWTGAPQASTEIANIWVDIAVDRGLPITHSQKLFWSTRIVAILVMILEWICFSYVTVFLMEQIF